jgi:hypothetical protein
VPAVPVRLGEVGIRPWARVNGPAFSAERVVQEANDVARDRGWGTSFRGVCVLRAGTKGETRVVIEPFTLENLRMSGIEFGSGDWVIVSQR